MKRLVVILLCLTCLIGLADRRGQIMSQRPTSAAFSPADISPDLWLKADYITGLTNDADVNPWLDATANHFNASPDGSLTFAPTYKTNVLHGLPGVVYGQLNGGASGAGSSTTLTRSQNQPFTVIALAQPTNTVSGGRRIVQDDSLDNWLIGPYGGSWQMFDGAFITGPAIDTNAHIIAATQQTGLQVLYLDGSQVGSNNAAGANNWLTTGLSVGWTHIHEPIQGYVFEVIAWKRILTSNELFLTTSYLSNKWSLP